MAVSAALMTELLELSEADRAEVADALLASLDADPANEDVTAAWDAEIEDRILEDDEGVAEWVDGEQALQQIRDELDRDRR
jgi:hypothetical protein